MDKFIKILVSLENWIVNNPKTALAIGIFIAGFIFGLIF